MHLPCELSHKPVLNTKLVLLGCLSWGWPLFPSPEPCWELWVLGMFLLHLHNGHRNSLC